MTKISNEDYSYSDHNACYAREQKYQESVGSRGTEQNDRERIVYNYYVEQQKKHQQRVDSLSWEIFKDLVFVQFKDGYNHLQELYDEMLKTMECYNKAKDQNSLNVYLPPHPLEPHYANPQSWGPIRR